MDFQKAKIYLDKLNREFARMSKDQENVLRIDVDIMGSYVRELYDAILSEPNIQVASKAESAPVRHPHRPQVPEPVAELAPTPPQPVAPVVAEVPPPAPPAPPPVREEPPAPAPPPIETPKPAPPSPPVSAPVGIDALFEEKQAKELVDKLAETPLADLKKGIPLNDRLLFTSELFAGDGQAFEKALGALNSFSNFEEARDYLVQTCAVYYTWTDKKRLETAKTFIRLVRRRYK